MTPSLPVAESFHETFCAQYGVPPELYSATVLRITLYPHARWLASARSRRLLAADRYFITRVGRLTRWGGFEAEADAFARMPANCQFSRRILRLRVSVGRMRMLFSEVMGGTPAADPNESRLRDEIRREPGSLVAAAD